MKDNKPEKDVTFDWGSPFKLWDFSLRADNGHLYVPDWAEKATEQANSRFRDLVKEHGKRVYGNHYGINQDPYLWSLRQNPKDTHTAILICEKEILK